MKRLLFLATILLSLTSIYSQSLGYTDLGPLFSSDQNNGTARFKAMSGAFGALGGDLSAIDINPAGGAVFLNDVFSATFSSRNTKTNTSFYGNEDIVENDFSNFSQAGGVSIIDNSFGNSNWKKIAIGFNYTLSSDFENSWIARGNSQFATWINDPVDENIEYLIVDEQSFQNFTDGSNKKYTFSLAGQYDNNLYIGAAITSYNLNFSQNSILEEFNSDENGNTVDAYLNQWQTTTGDGVSLSFGIISKPTKEIRIGLAYQSPIWYNLHESSNLFATDANDEPGYYELTYSNDPDVFYSNDFDKSQVFDYNLRTPSKTTLSFAYVLGTHGLMSIDYSYKNFNKLQLSGGDFSEENILFARELKNTSTVNVGTEWRTNGLSFRGGYHYEQSPDKNAIDSDHIKGYSLGIGYNFGHVKLDLAYNNSNKTEIYDFYPQYSQINPADLKIDNSHVTATLTFSM